MTKKSRLSEIHILVVDDDAMVRSILTQFLQRFGFKNVVDVKDGKDALKYVQDNEERLDLVISDWEMPEADGLTVLKAIRKHPRRQSTKFIMVTSQGSRERIKITQAARWRVDAYLVKPFKGETLREKLIEVLGDDIEKELEPLAS
ncbi:MAG: response regulator [Bdellovibrionales bacterium]|nr:response regulator [Bdellovibrionales bacterium]